MGRKVKYLMDEWMNRMWDTHTVEYYSILKKKGNSVTNYHIHEAWNSRLSEISQLQRSTIVWLSFNEATKVTKFIEVENGIVVARGHRQSTFNWYRISYGKIENVLEVGCSESYRAVKTNLLPQNTALMGAGGLYEHRTSCMLEKCSTSELHLSPIDFFLNKTILNLVVCTLHYLEVKCTHICSLLWKVLKSQRWI